MLIISIVRLRILWGAIVTVILLFCAIALFQNFWSTSSARLSRIQNESKMENSDTINYNIERTSSSIATEGDKVDKKRESMRSNRWQYILDEL